MAVSASLTVIWVERRGEIPYSLSLGHSPYTLTPFKEVTKHFPLLLSLLLKCAVQLRMKLGDHSYWRNLLGLELQITRYKWPLAGTSCNVWLDSVCSSVILPLCPPKITA